MSAIMTLGLCSNRQGGVHYQMNKSLEANAQFLRTKNKNLKLETRSTLYSILLKFLIVRQKNLSSCDLR
jgi:hypothetical protein